MDRLTTLLSGVLEKLDWNAEVSPPRRSFSGVSAVHALSSSEEEEGELLECAPVPLDALEKLSSMPPALREDVGEDNAGFLRALDELSGYFHGEEQKGEPLSGRLATIL